MARAHNPDLQLYPITILKHFFPAVEAGGRGFLVPNPRRPKRLIEVDQTRGIWWLSDGERREWADPVGGIEELLQYAFRWSAARAARELEALREAKTAEADAKAAAGRGAGRIHGVQPARPAKAAPVVRRAPATQIAPPARPTGTDDWDAILAAEAKECLAMEAGQVVADDVLFDLLEPVVRYFRGTPKRSKDNELRFGRRRGLSVDLRKGVWCDHGNGNIGGRTLEFVMHEAGLSSRAEALDWLRRNKFLGAGG